jgi:Cysteine-rich secretory protein family
VNTTPSTIDRRWFLKVSAAFALVPATARGQVPIERGRFSEDDIPPTRTRLLELVNAERASMGLSRLALDDLACEVADKHARDMATGRFLSHWGRDGAKPYHRYSFAGGIDAIQENVGSANDILSLTAGGVAGDLIGLHQAMLNEIPPDDGHRRTILYPHHTHVGFGIAVNDQSLKLDELYISRFVALDPFPRQAKPKTTVILSGRVLDKRNSLKVAELYYEPLPTPPAIEWLRVARSYGMPDPFVTLYPKLPENVFYVNGMSGTIELSGGGRFQMPVTLSKRAGINTISLWIKRGQSAAFPATQICIRAE